MAIINGNPGDNATHVEPHFNDEHTIRAAQPVVPLEAVMKERRRRRLMLAGAFIIASLLGSTAALALIRLRQPTVVSDVTVTPAEENTENQSEEQAAQSAETETAEVASGNASATVPDDVEYGQAKKEKRKKSKHAAASPVQITVTTSQPDSGEARLVGQWEERRQRRVRNRNPEQNHHSDLFRIREIFEGPRRPRRTNNQ